MKTPTPIELLFDQEINAVATASNEVSTNLPGSNPWIKYIVVAGIVIIAFTIAHEMTKKNQTVLKPLKNEDER